MLPSWWPRTVCVYCGARLSPYRRVRLVVACEKHMILLASDPMLAADYREETQAAREREGC